jgi:hypothetical protein
VELRVPLFLTGFSLSFPQGFKKIDNGRLFLIAISTMGAAEEIATFRKKAARMASHLLWFELFSTKRAP